MPDELNLNLLRAYVDGELSDEEAHDVEGMIARDPNWQLALEAESQLRHSIDEFMTRHAAVAPTELRERIAADFKREPATDAATDSPNAVEAASDTASSKPSQAGWLATISALLNQPQRVSFGAIATVVVLVSMVVLYGIFGLPIDHRANPPMQPSMLLSEAAEHVSQEHDRCASDESVLLEKLVAMTRADAAIRLQAHLGVDSVTIFDLSELGYEFVGLGPCNMPGTAPSAHLVYRRNLAGKPKSMMSIFVTPDVGQFGEKCPNVARSKGRWRGVCGGKTCQKTILHGTDDRLAYFLACGFADQVQQVSEVLCKALARRGR